MDKIADVLLLDDHDSSRSTTTTTTTAASTLTKPKIRTVVRPKATPSAYDPAANLMTVVVGTDWKPFTDEGDQQKSSGGIWVVEVLRKDTDKSPYSEKETSDLLRQTFEVKDSAPIVSQAPSQPVVSQAPSQQVGGVGDEAISQIPSQAGLMMERHYAPTVSRTNSPHGIMTFYGGMFGGKTSKLMNQVRQYLQCGFTVLVIKFDKDARYSKGCVVASHNRDTLSADVSVNKLSDVDSKDIENSQIIAIDEGQMYPDLFDFSILYGIKRRKLVMVAALDLDANQKPFGDTLRLLPFGRSIQLLAVCQTCRRKRATLTKCKIDLKDQQIRVGGSELYEAICSQCKLGTSS